MPGHLEQVTTVKFVVNSAVTFGALSYCAHNLAKGKSKELFRQTGHGNRYRVGFHTFAHY